MSVTRRQMIAGLPLALAACGPSRAALISAALDAPAPALSFPGTDAVPAAHLPRATRPRVTAFSGGGPDGAFGAGYTVGQAEAGARRPDIVTGVSIGALVGTLAFAGDTGALVRLFAEGGLEKVARDFSTTQALTRGSVATGSTYAAAIVNAVTDPVIARIAEQHRTGRRLFVVASDFEAARPVVWDIGAIAGQTAEGTADFLHRVLLASASIPGIFPTVALAEPGQPARLFVDGGVTMQFYLPVMPRGRAISDALIVIDNQVEGSIPLDRTGIFNVVAHGLSALIRTQYGDEIVLGTERITRRGGRVRMVSIPPELPKTHIQDWNAAQMRTRFDTGRKMARA